MIAEQEHQALLLRKPLLAEAERAQAALKADPNPNPNPSPDWKAALQEAREKRDAIREELDEVL